MRQSYCGRIFRASIDLSSPGHRIGFASMTDFELLREYASSKSEEAFATLVERYGSLVHSAALRQVRDRHMAEDISQAVFILLARKAAQISAKTVLSGWLLRTARFVALNASRRKSHRLHSEQEIMNQYSAET